MAVHSASQDSCPGSTAADSEVVLLPPSKTDIPHWLSRKPGVLNNRDKRGSNFPLTWSTPQRRSEQRQAADDARAALSGKRGAVTKPRRRPVQLHVPRLTLFRRSRTTERLIGHMFVLALAIAAIAIGNNVGDPHSVGMLSIGRIPSDQSSSEELERRPVSMLTTSAVGGRQRPRDEMIPATGLPQPKRGPAFGVEHRVAPGETLGDIARRYQVSVLSIASSNNLGDGQPLAIGQLLRIPRISGVPHVIQEGETLESIASHYNVSLAAIVGYGPNDLVAGDPLPVGQEIFIPGGTLPIGSGGLSTRSEQELAAIKAEPIATVIAPDVQIHEGPSSIYEPIADLLPGDQLRLTGYFGDWFKVELPGLGMGWVSAQALNIPPGALVNLPETNDFPAFVPTATVRDDGTNIRLGPDIFYDSIGALSAGARVRLVGHYNNWFKIEYADGTQGWMANEVLNVRPEVAATVPEATDLPPPVPVATVLNDESNVREGPATIYDSIAKLPAGTRVRLLARHEDWFKVIQANGEVGWMASEILSVPADLAAELPETDDFPAPPPIWVWPTYGEFTSGFGWRRFPWRMFHDGIDIANRQGTPIVAARTGTVVEAGWCSGFGYCVKMAHDGGFSTIYGHMMSRPVVRVGDYVKAGQLIGYMGSTYDRAGGGYSTGPHLHFTVKLDGVPVNPLNYLP